MVDLDSNPTKLIEIVEVGKQLLITRGALTTFSIANDVAKYFAILPAMFATTYATGGGERAARATQRHEPRHAAERDHLGDHLQRADHPRARAARAARRQVPGDRRDGAAAAQPAHLRARRRDPAVHRDQADRPASSTTSSGREPDLRIGACGAGTGSCSGMAAGVGKTYRMLQEGRQAQAEGRDVVIGYLEPHDRPETAALAEGLEVVPRLRVEHGAARARGDGRRRGHPAGAGARARRRARAHERARARATRSATRTSRRSSTPASTSISTVNVQHLESLNDAVFELTDVRVRETFPDRDPRRGRRGRARRPLAGGAAGAAAGREGLPAGARRRRALELLPPREPRRAARARAAGGGRGRRGTAARPTVLDPLSQQAVAERVLALVEPQPRVAADPAPRVALGAAARRRARRALGAAAGQELSAEEATQLAALRRLASILGAHFLEEEGDDLVDAVRRVVAERGSTYVFVGTPDERRRVRDPARLARLAHRPRAAGDRHPRRRRPSAAADGARRR